MLCQVCLNPKRKPRFNSCRITICQWCVSELTKDREDTPQSAINTVRLQYETEQIREIRYLKFEADSPIIPPRYPERELSQATYYALGEAKYNEKFLTSVYRSLINDRERKEEAQKITAKMQQQIIARYEESVQAYQRELSRKEEVKKEYQSLEASLNDRVDEYITRYRALLFTSGPLKSKRDRLIHAFQLGLINAEKVVLNRLDEEENERFRSFIKSQDSHACVICQKSSAQSELHVHHIIPLSKYGTNQPQNHVTLCYSCHEKQHSALKISRNKSARLEPRKNSFIAVAIKTTGYFSSFHCIDNRDEIYEIGAALFENGAVIDKFHSFMYTERYRPSKAEEFTTGISKNLIEKADRLNKVFPRFMVFIGKSNLVVHDANYVMFFLHKYAHFCNMEISNNVTDTIDIAIKKLTQQENYDLLSLGKYLNIRKEAGHSALDDSILNGLVLLHLASFREEKLILPVKKNTVKGNSNKHLLTVKKSSSRSAARTDSIAIGDGPSSQKAHSARIARSIPANNSLPTLTGNESVEDAYNEYKQEHYKTAFHIYRNLAKQGVVIAQYNLGIMYENGYGIEKHFKHAVYCYQKAAEQGFASAQCNLGRMYNHGRGIEQNYDQACTWYRRAADQGNAEAQCNLGYMYSKGRGVEQSYHLAVELYRKAAEQENTLAQNNLGYMYDQGQGVEQCYHLAVQWYRKAAAQGNANAQNNLGVMYKYGRGVEQDYEQAISWFLKSAEHGYANAQFNLGWIYANGTRVDQDDKLAVNWYRKAAAQGNAAAQNNLGWMYDTGRGVEQSDDYAVLWYKKAASQCDATAQCNLGRMYEHGRGIEQDYKQACVWYRKAAQQGNATAQVNLGLMYEKGHGVDQNYEQAILWYRKATEQGNTAAQSNLERLAKDGLIKDNFLTEGVEQNTNSLNTVQKIKDKSDIELINEYHESLAYGDLESAFIFYKELWGRCQLEFENKVNSQDLQKIGYKINGFIATKDQSYEAIINSYHESIAYGELDQARILYAKLLEYNYAEFQLRVKKKAEKKQDSYKLFDIGKNCLSLKKTIYDDQMIDQYFEALCYGDSDKADVLYRQLIGKQFDELFR
jgi:TPR repeat protein